MDRGLITYDSASGRLVLGEVWMPSVDVPDDENLAWADVCSDVNSPDNEEVPDCPLHHHHTLQTLVQMDVELFGGVRLGDFVYNHMTGGFFVSGEFSRRLHESKLTGFRTRENITIVRNPYDIPNAQILQVEATSNPILDFRYGLENAPNACPHCGNEPMICSGCGRVNIPCCSKCDRWTIFNPEYPEYSDPNGLRVKRYEGPSIIEAKDWDGSDWFRQGGMLFVSNRAKEWMERTHTHPIEFKPALLNIEGVEDKFKGK